MFESDRSIFQIFAAVAVEALENYGGRLASLGSAMTRVPTETEDLIEGRPFEFKYVEFRNSRGSEEASLTALLACERHQHSTAQWKTCQVRGQT